MLKKLSTLTAAAVLAITLTGCGLQSGKTVVKYTNGDGTRLTEAAKAGTYALYGRSDATPQITYNLEQGDEVGFRNEGGKVTAVAGSNSLNLDPGTLTGYYWKYQGK